MQAPLGGVQGVGIQFQPQFQPQFQGMRRPVGRPIGAFDEPNLREVRHGIPTPLIEANNFEVKSSLINMAQNQRYNGLPLEDPLDHLDQFERLCRTVKINGVPEDSIKMILFPFSLGNKASQWEKNVPSELVSSWEDVKKEFVTKFYPKQKTAKLRNDITSFKQGSHENLYEAWERLKDYTRKCPHHGVSQENLLGIFYRGALEQYRRALDTASYGCFANLTAVQGEQLIDNLAQSDACYGGDYDRNMRDQDLENTRYKELTEKLDKLSKVFLVNQKAVNFVGETSYDQQGYNEGVGEDIQQVQEEVNYLGNQSNYQGGYQNNYQQGYQNRPFTPNYGNNNLSYRSNNVANPQDQYYPPRAPQGNQFQQRPYGNASQSNNASWRSQGAQGQSPTTGYQGDNKFRPQGQGQPRQNTFPPAQASEQDDMKNMMRQIMEGQVKAQQDLTEKMEKIERKIDSNHGEAQAKFEDIYSHLKILDNQIAQVGEAQAKFGDIYSHLKTLDNQIAQVASSSQRPAGSLHGKPEANPKEYCQAIMLRSGKELPSGNTAEESSDSQEETEKPEEKELSVEKEADNDVLAEEDISEKKKEKKAQETPKTEDKTEYVLPPYEPKLPFPGRFKKQMLDKQYEKFKKLLETVEVTIPLTDLVLDCPIYNKLLKDIITKKRIIEEAMVQVKHECSAILQQNLPKKLQDPGSFTLPCTIGPLSFGKCLVDLGASVSLMPLTVSRKLGLTNFKKTRISLVLADRSTRYPIGILENVPLKIGECLIPTDFVVLEMDREPTDPIILGRPFLATAGAIINVKKGIIDLQMGSSVLKFDIMEAVKKPTIEMKVFSMEEQETKNDGLLTKMCVENPLKNVLLVEKEEYELNADSKEDKEPLNSLKVDKGKKDFLELKQGVHYMELDGLKTEEISIEDAEINDEWSELITPKTTCTHPPTSNQPARKRVGTRKKRIRTDQEKVRSISKMGRVTRGMKKDEGDFAGNGQKKKAVVSLHAHPPI